MASRIELPETLSQWIRTHVPGIGDPRRLQFRACKRIPFWWIPGNRNMAGLTLGNRVYLREEYCPIDASRRDAIELVFHELIHVLQFRANPFLFPFRYLFNHLRHGYLNNPAEVEARNSAARLLSDYLRDRTAA